MFKKKFFFTRLTKSLNTMLILFLKKRAMLRLFVLSWFIATAWAGCPLSPTSEQTSAERLPGDGGYRILVSGDYDKYIPNAVYTISLQGIAYLLFELSPSRCEIICSRIHFQI